MGAIFIWYLFTGRTWSEIGIYWASNSTDLSPCLLLVLIILYVLFVHHMFLLNICLLHSSWSYGFLISQCCLDHITQWLIFYSLCLWLLCVVSLSCNISFYLNQTYILCMFFVAFRLTIYDYNTVNVFGPLLTYAAHKLKS